MNKVPGKTARSFLWVSHSGTFINQMPRYREDEKYRDMQKTPLPRAMSAWHFTYIYIYTHTVLLTEGSLLSWALQAGRGRRGCSRSQPSTRSTCEHLSLLRSSFYFLPQSNIQAAGEPEPKKEAAKSNSAVFNIKEKRLQSWMDSRLVMSIIYLLLNLFHLPSEVSQWQIDRLECAILLSSYYSVSAEDGMFSCVWAIKGRDRPPWPSITPEAPYAVQVKMGAKTSSHFITANRKVLGEDAALILYIHT